MRFFDEILTSTSSVSGKNYFWDSLLKIKAVKMETQKQKDKGTDFTFYVLFVSMALGALLSIGYLLSTFF